MLRISGVDRDVERIHAQKHFALRDTQPDATGKPGRRLHVPAAKGPGHGYSRGDARHPRRRRSPWVAHI
jgi:hypothetical protein